MKNDWNAQLYDSKLRFVSEFGKDVVALLHPKAGEKILDLGCGTGDLSFEISKLGASVVGMDLSHSMIQEALAKYPNLQFKVENGEEFRTEEKFDAVFSNAALHWMKRAANVIESVWIALKPGGRFVAEFGGKGNVELVDQRIRKRLTCVWNICSREKPLVLSECWRVCLFA
jgi:trans-aconitate methyltransferase